MTSHPEKSHGKKPEHGGDGDTPIELVQSALPTEMVEKLDPEEFSEAASDEAGMFINFVSDPVAKSGSHTPSGGGDHHAH